MLIIRQLRSRTLFPTCRGLVVLGAAAALRPPSHLISSEDTSPSRDPVIPKKRRDHLVSPHLSREAWITPEKCPHFLTCSPLEVQVCRHMYAHMLKAIQTCMCSMHRPIQASMCTHVHNQACPWVRVHTCMRAAMCEHACTYVYMHLDAHAHMNMCVHVCTAPFNPRALGRH